MTRWAVRWEKGHQCGSIGVAANDEAEAVHEALKTLRKRFFLSGDPTITKVRRIPGGADKPVDLLEKGENFQG